jgi:hypothetical protein
VSWLTYTISGLSAGVVVVAAVLSAGLFWLHAAMLPASNTPKVIFVKIEAVVFILIGFYCVFTQEILIVLICVNFDKDKLSTQVS